MGPVEEVEIAELFPLQQLLIQIHLVRMRQQPAELLPTRTVGSFQVSGSAKISRRETNGDKRFPLGAHGSALPTTGERRGRDEHCLQKVSVLARSRKVSDSFDDVQTPAGDNRRRMPTDQTTFGGPTDRSKWFSPGQRFLEPLLRMAG
jgi:hypothetical protein